ncbi:MAG: PIN domain nuclease [Planctomycetia bacterium]|nr:PIN domain nuclease [Planctomycetia bacterium]
MILLDTHALLWMDGNDPMLGPLARALIETAWRSDVVAVSAISFWETALLADRGRIALPVPVEAWRLDLLQAGLREITIDGRRVSIEEMAPAQATLVTADVKILGWAGDLPRQAATA